MGKKIVVKGADFSRVAVLDIDNMVVHKESELLTTRGYFVLSDSTPRTLTLKSVPNGAYYCAILPLKQGMFIENATALIASMVGKGGPRMPAVAFLSSNSVSGYIQNSEVYGKVQGSNPDFGIYSGTLNPPVGATHVAITTNTLYGGDLSTIIAWNKEE